MSTHEPDERCPEGMNYLDWLMKVLKPDEMTPQNIDEIIEQMRRHRIASESGVKVKKGDPAPKLSLKDLGFKVKKKPIITRRLG